MAKFGECIDGLLKDNQTDAFSIASFATLMIGEIHPFNEGAGRTSRLLMNYILIRKGLKPKNLDAELLDVGDTHHMIADHEIDSEKEFGRTILEFSHSNDKKIWDTVFDKKYTTYPKKK